MLYKAKGLCDAMTPDHRFRLISYFVFSTGLLPQSVWYFPPIGLPTIVSSGSNDAHEGEMLCLKKYKGGGREERGGVNAGGVMAADC